MTTPAETLAGWRTELVEECELLLNELKEATEERHLAELAYRDAQAECTALCELVERGVGWQSTMSGHLYGRLENERREMLRVTSRARGRAVARCKSLDEDIAGRRLGIAQLDRALAPAEEVTGEPIVTRPKPTPIDFDVIIATPKGTQ